MHRGLNAWLLLTVSLVLTMAACGGGGQSGGAGPQPPPGPPVNPTARVFVDVDGDGSFSAGDEPLAGVAVSDGTQVVLTDAQGQYSLPAPTEPVLVRLTIPAGYWPVGNRWFERVEAGQPPRSDFPLRPQAQSTPWRFVHVTDIHYIPQAQAAVQSFLSRAAGHTPRPAMIVNTGDLVMTVNTVSDEATIERVFREYREALAASALPWFDLPGNHDKAGNQSELPLDSPWFSTRGFERAIGPAWYSLEYAGARLLMLDSYPPRPGSRGHDQGLSERCLGWLERDLAVTPPDRPLLVFFHHPPERWINWHRLRALLQGRTVLGIFCGHEHAVRETTVDGWPVFVSGALSGAKWLGPCPDGSPRGYRLVTVRESSVETSYEPAS